MRVLVCLVVLAVGVGCYGQRSTAVGFGTTLTDYCGTVWVSRMFYGNEGKLEKFVYGNGIYGTAGKGRYPEWNAGKAMDHWKVSMGFMWGAYWIEEEWWPTLNVGLAKNWTNCYPGYGRIEGEPIYRDFNLEFGSSAQIGWYYPWVIVSVGRQLEMTFGASIIF